MLPLPAGRSMTAISMYQALRRGDLRGSVGQRLRTFSPAAASVEVGQKPPVPAVQVFTMGRNTQYK